MATKYTKNAIFLLLLLLNYSTTWSQVVINEFSAANYTGPTDNYGEREDWIEL